ncbi:MULTISPECIES: hypothetical protein [unclassified Sinorhizobium]|uniref:hypothetical protein n=1 Tax=unclassified Sinorhizobium TaxID=2613772 RepID=UPI003523CB68
MTTERQWCGSCRLRIRHAATQPDTIEIPAATKHRLGLDDERSWIVLTESNRFVWPEPDVRPIDSDGGYYGPLPPALFAEVSNALLRLPGSKPIDPRPAASEADIIRLNEGEAGPDTFLRGRCSLPSENAASKAADRPLRQTRISS